MSAFPWGDLAILLALIAINGVLSMSELAIVSARKPRLDAMARKGRGGAQTAIDLAADPGRFLSTVQIGITLVGIVAGAYSGASFREPVGAMLESGLGLDPATARTAALIAVIGTTTYLSLVIGELVPKQFALRSPEAIAAVVALPMRWLARLTAPLVWLLDGSSALIFRLLRMQRESDSRVTAEELHMVVAEAVLRLALAAGQGGRKVLRLVDPAHALECALQAGTVHVNQYDEDDITVPFGGVKQSGNGRDKSLHAFDKYTELKTTWMRIESA